MGSWTQRRRCVPLAEGNTLLREREESAGGRGGTPRLARSRGTLYALWVDRPQAGGIAESMRGRQHGTGRGSPVTCPSPGARVGCPQTASHTPRSAGRTTKRDAGDAGAASAQTLAAQPSATSRVANVCGSKGYKCLNHTCEDARMCRHSGQHVTGLDRRLRQRFQPSSGPRQGHHIATAATQQPMQRQTAPGRALPTVERGCTLVPERVAVALCLRLPLSSSGCDPSPGST
jgi:predicted component of type VI protein secretion system